jgi:excinuclease ABC subunit C
MVRQRARAVSTPELKRDIAAEGLRALAEHLGLAAPPHVIEGFDISHIGGTLTVASMVVCVDGLPARSRYRHFRIRTVEGADDPRSIAEVVQRRYSRVREEGQAVPDLVMVDGGITQLRAARTVLAELGLAAVPAVGLAKRIEELVLDNGRAPLLLPRDSPALQVLMRLRDEAHRFAITYNRALRARKMRESVLDEIAGVGPRRKELLLQRFGSAHRLARAPVADIAAVGGVGEELATAIVEALRRVLHVANGLEP